LAAIAQFYPKSTYAQSLAKDLIEHAKTLVVRPPEIGAKVTGSQCGSPHSVPAGMTELIALTVLHCGASVKLEPSWGAAAPLRWFAWLRTGTAAGRLLPSVIGAQIFWGHNNAHCYNGEFWNSWSARSFSTGIGITF
jgi:hypothetical protein